MAVCAEYRACGRLAGIVSKTAHFREHFLPCSPLVVKLRSATGNRLEDRSAPPLVRCPYGLKAQAGSRLKEEFHGALRHTGIGRIPGQSVFEPDLPAKLRGDPFLRLWRTRPGERRDFHRRSAPWRVAPWRADGCAGPAVPPRWADVRRRCGGNSPPSHTGTGGPADGVRPPGPAREGRPSAGCTGCGLGRRSDGTADRSPLRPAHVRPRRHDQPRRQPGRR